MKIKFLVVGLGLLLAGLVIIFWPKSLPQKLSAPFATNVRFPYATSENKFLYFSGSSFVEYNLLTHQTGRKTNIFSLPVVTDVKWSPEGALFKASGYTDVDDLKPKLDELLMPLDLSYWWLIDFKTNEIRLLGGYEKAPTVIDAVWADESSYVYLAGPVDDHDDATSIVVGSIGGTEVVAAELPEAARLFWADRHSAIVATRVEAASALEKISFSDKRKESLVEGEIVEAVVSPSGERAVVIVGAAENPDQHAHGLGDAYLYEKGAKLEKLISDFSGAVSWSRDSGSFMAAGYGEEKPLFLSQETKKGRVKKYFNKLAGDIKSLAYLNSSSLTTLFVNEAQEASLASKEKQLVSAVPKTKAPFLESEKTVYGGGFYIAFFPDKNQYAIYVTSQPFAQKQTDALNFIKNRGYDPNQLDLRWYYDG